MEPQQDTTQPSPINNQAPDPKKTGFERIISVVQKNPQKMFEMLVLVFAVFIVIKLVITNFL